MLREVGDSGVAFLLAMSHWGVFVMGVSVGGEEGPGLLWPDNSGWGYGWWEKLGWGWVGRTVGSAEGAQDRQGHLPHNGLKHGWSRHRHGDCGTAVPTQADRHNRAGTHNVCQVPSGITPVQQARSGNLRYSTHAVFKAPCVTSSKSSYLCCLRPKPLEAADV